MSLSDSQLERYARQVITPGVGAEGQELLLGAEVLVVGAERDCSIAEEYLSRSGVKVCRTLTTGVDCIVACEIAALADVELAKLGTENAPLVWYHLDGRTLFSGSVDSFDGCRPRALRSTGSECSESTSLALASLAACDAAASAIALLLAWPDIDRNPRENALG